MTAVKVKKVSPYPIAVALTGPESAQGRAMKLTTVGLLVETDRPLPLGGQFTLGFVIPVLNRAVQTVGVVIKTYARYGGEPGKSKSHTLNEIHFKSLGEEDKIAIQSFLSAIHQV
jgi:hypothetical protein